MTPRDIHRAIGLLLEDIGNREIHECAGLEDAGTLREWWEVEPVADRESGSTHIQNGWSLILGRSMNRTDWKAADEEERRKFELIRSFKKVSRSLARIAHRDQGP